MRRFILTGTPGSGKTSILRELERRGFEVIEEAATDVIAAEHGRGNDEPWRDPSFIDSIATLQGQRMLSPARSGDIQFHDRSLICTLALCRHLGYPVPHSLNDAIQTMIAQHLFDPRVFFVENLGFVTPTDARRISFEDSLVFERIHRETYRTLGLDCVSIGHGPVSQRADTIVEIVARPVTPR